MKTFCLKIEVTEKDLQIYLNVPDHLKSVGMSSMELEDRKLMGAISMCTEWAKGTAADLKKSYTLHINDKKTLTVNEYKDI